MVVVMEEQVVEEVVEVEEEEVVEVEVEEGCSKVSLCQSQSPSTPALATASPC